MAVAAADLSVRLRFSGTGAGAGATACTTLTGTEWLLTEWNPSEDMVLFIVRQEKKIEFATFFTYTKFLKEMSVYFLYFGNQTMVDELANDAYVPNQDDEKQIENVDQETIENKIENVNKKKRKMITKKVKAKKEDTDDDLEEVEGHRSDDGSDNGSDLEDFIIKGEDDEPEVCADDANDYANDDGIDVNQIVYGKRTRKAPVRYVDTYGFEDHRNAMLADIAPDELHAAIYESVSGDEEEHSNSDNEDDTEDDDDDVTTDDTDDDQLKA